MKSWISSKLEHIRWGFEAISNAIYFRSDLEDNIDRCAFFYELNCGWYEMNNIDELEGKDPYNLSGRDPYYSYMMRK